MGYGDCIVTQVLIEITHLYIQILSTLKQMVEGILKLDCQIYAFLGMDYNSQ